MKHKVGPGSVRGTSRTSAIEATSECVIPPAHRICSRSGDGFAFTAYIERPGNFSTKNRAARAAACGRTSVTGWAGLPLAISMPHVTSRGAVARSEEHTSELQSLMRIPYAVFCLKKKNNQPQIYTTQDIYQTTSYMN